MLEEGLGEGGGEWSGTYLLFSRFDQMKRICLTKDKRHQQNVLSIKLVSFMYFFYSFHHFSLLFIIAIPLFNATHTTFVFVHQAQLGPDADNNQVLL
jgi:hypothetical protein